MRIAFFGHSDFVDSKEVQEKLGNILRGVASCDTEFLFGNYGGFDRFVFSFVRSNFPGRKIFVTPYITEEYQKSRLRYAEEEYDEIIYPEIENVPYRFAISARNKWMAETSDLIICYINRSFGGAYSAVVHAKRRKKKIINLGNLEI